MEVVDPRSALLSNYEVLELLRELENEHIARTKTAHRIKKEEEASGSPSKAQTEPVTSENLRTIQIEAIQYLTADYQPTNSQTPEGIKRLIKDLGEYDLTKAEKLQVVNLAPTQPVELYVVVEELEDRLGESMNDVLGKIKSSLSERAEPFISTIFDDVPTGGSNTGWGSSYPDNDGDAEMEMDAVNDLVFDDTGEGAGIEGDLEMDDD
ncbi:dna-directed rna polymerase iii subunit rpc9-like [Moniliophthora roreri MCA 2997]|uniref:DNA-directed RNA polymerase III subunit RPC9 n=2 Tax=Moniliophthora roreri TaxID=221103 RepID=V2X843_MONRO|nr:dna-directed rna polymerase iii subunit rpc9-like [Moniliophthora roreri MCA 2997]KAI3615531.1 dna-directed rna polymerase iii subunit rpc9-like [Moniliophthora roreri]